MQPMSELGSTTLEDNEVFSKMRDDMRKGGLHLFSEVTIDQNDAPFFIPSKKARITKQFYWCERKKIIVILARTERIFEVKGDESEHLSSHWEIEVIMGYIRKWEDLEEIVPGGKISDIPFLSAETRDNNLPLGFQLTGSSYSGSERVVTMSMYIDQKNSVGIAESAIRIKNKVEKYLENNYFDGLWVYTFPPSYTFKGCEEVFWSRFDKRNLRAIIKKPYGSSGLKR